MTLINPKRLDKLKKKDYRHSYLREMTIGWIVHQIRELRAEREWSQSRLGKETGKPQSAIARIEDLDYGKWSTSTLLDLAEAFDVAIEVRFSDWPTFLRSTENTSPENMRVPSFSLDEFVAIPDGVSGTNDSRIKIKESNIVDFKSASRNELVLDGNDRLRLSSAQTPLKIKNELPSVERMELANGQ
jgi:transcriptional regulator with XRE-family HTH domain